MKKKKSFCNGILCRKTDRRYVCNICKVFCCAICTNFYKKKSYCIDCYVEYFLLTDLKSSLSFLGFQKL